ncbi:DUF4347 domain-containing protein [Marinobacterium rhizophilum]|uniref:DUF4347 domain-containing protein n=1 Tax=Marinobacterium rhizophilum TaxID=420402 RepID=UPI00037CB627|nr:DUF4347 domain-containing protein [Marinobacterium rhizophilum]
MNKIFYQGKKARKAGKKKQNLQFEALENRVLLSADLGISATDLQQPDTVTDSSVIESELQLAGFDSSEFEPETIAVDASLTRLADSFSATPQAAADGEIAETAPEDVVSVEEVPADEVQAEPGPSLTPDELYLVERMMASQVVILDASVPQLESVINELFNTPEAELASTLETLQARPLDLFGAVVADATAEPATADMADALVGATLSQQLLVNADRDIKVFVLDAERDGVEQISSLLDYFENVAAIHLLSHGSAGALFLGSSKLSTQQLKNSQQQLKRWGSALSEDGDILLYGCDVAEGELGLEFVETLASLTGADVAASTDDTGNLPGADWDLERTVGQVEAQSLSSAAMLGVLATTPTDTNDTLTNPTGTIAGLKGNDAYVFTTNSFGVVTVKELKNEGTDTLDLSALTVDLTFTIKKDNVVVVTYSSGGTANKITATQVENIKGGTGNDTFIVQKGAVLNGYLDGGAGTNTLRYTDPDAGLIFDKSYTGSVAVDFSVGTAADSARATAIDGFAVGKVLNIQKVIGGNSDDLLKGHTAADDLSGGKGDDTLQGAGGADALKGDAGDDHLDGGADTDTLEGGAGNDTLVASAGGDTLIGGTGDDLYEFSDAANWTGTTVTELSAGGNDTLDFSGVAAALTFTVNDLAVTGLTAAAGGSTLSGAKYIERIIAGSGTNTFNFKNAWANKLFIEATAGASVSVDFSAVTTDLFFTIKANGTVLVSDTDSRSGGHRVTLSNVDNLIGGQGSNTFRFAEGGSISGNLDGGSGTGILDYSQFGLTMVVDLSSGATPVPGVGGTLSNIDEVVGSAKQDLLTAADSGQSLSGDRGDDVLFGGAGSDVLAGDQGDDTLVGGGGNDSFDGGTGDDTYLFSGSWGQDTAVTELANGGSDTISFAGMDLQAATGTLPQIDAIAAVSADLTLTFNSDGSLNVTDDSATANTLAVAASSLPEIESLLGGSGSNTYLFNDDWGHGRSTNILLDDTASSDGTLDFSALTSDLQFVISDDNGVTVVTVTTAVGGKVYTVTARGVENLIGGLGDNQYRFEGAAVLGGSLTGFSGAGTATLDFSDYDGGSSYGVKVDLAAGTARATVDPLDATQDTALITGTLSNINDLVGSAFGDELTGDAEVNVLEGGAGDDTLKGGAQNDMLIGGKGSDSLQGEGGDDTYGVEAKWASLDLSLTPTQTDTISDSDGANTLDLSDISKDLQITFTDATSGTDVAVKVALNSLLSNRINIDQAGSGTDTWTLKTGSGDDTVIIKDGVDSTVSLEAGEGSNTLDYFSGSDISGGYKSSVTVDLAAGTATGLAGISDFQHIFGSFSGGADQLIGDAEDNNFYVGIWGELDGTAARNHDIQGGDGNDTISFVNFDQSDFDLVMDLGNNIVTHTDAANTVMTVAVLGAIENLTGGAGNDTLIGDAGANILNGGAGDDSLEGGEGDDTYAFDSDWGLDSIVENLVEGTDVLDFSGVSEALTFNNGRGDGTEVDLATALTRNVTVTDGVSTLTADLNVENFAGVKETDTLEQANVTLTVAVQDEMIRGLEALKAVATGLSSGYSEFSSLLDLQLPLVGENLSGLLVDDSGVAVNIADQLALRIQAQIDALKTLFWGSTTEPDAADKTDSNTDALLALTDADGALFSITENTRLLEFGSSLELFTRTQPLDLNLGDSLSLIPGLSVDLSPNVTTTLTFNYAFGVLPADPADPAADLGFHVSNPGLNFAVSLFDDQIYAGLDFGVIAASIGGPGVDDAKGLLALNIDLTVGAEGDLGEQILLDTVTNNSFDSLFSLQAGKDLGITAELPVVVDVAGLGLDVPDLPTISLTTPALGEFPSLAELTSLFSNLDWSLPDLSELFDLGSISLDQLFDMMRGGLNYLVDNFDFSLNIPGLNLSLDDIFGNIPGFDLGLQDFLSGLVPSLEFFDVSLGLQGLEDWLNARLSDLLPDLWPDWSLPSFDFSYDGFDLGIDFDFDLNLGDLFAALGLPDLELGFDFDLADLANFLNLPDGFDPAALGITMAADGTLLVDADLDISLGLDFAAKDYAQAVIGNGGPGSLNIQDYAFIGDDTQVSLAVRAGADDIDVEASLSISDSLPAIGFWIENGSAIIEAVAAISLPQVANGRYQLSSFNAGDLSFEAGGEASLDLPMYLGTGSLPMGGSELDLNGDGYADNVLHAGFDFDLSGLSTPEVIAPNFAGFSLIAFLNDPATILAGLEGMFAGIKNVMAGELGRLGLPLIGDVLDQSGAFVDQLRDSLLGDKSSGDYVDGLGKELMDAAANGDDVISLIRDALFNALGDYLQVALTDGNGEPLYNELGNLIYGDVETADDIGLVLTAEGELTFNVLLAGSVFEGLADYVERTDPDTGAIIKRFLTVPINFDLSAPGLGLKTGPTDTIEVSLDYFFGLGFGLDSSGFFLDTAGVTEAGEELGLTLDASLSDGASLLGTLGFLQMRLSEVDDDDGNSGLRGKIAMDLRATADRWRFGEALTMAAQISAEANVDLFATLEMDFGADIALPNAFTTVHYDQQLADITWESGSSFSADFLAPPEVVLEDVTLDVGDLFSGFIGPIALELDPFLGQDSELRRVIDILTTDIDLGVDKINLLDIAVLAMNTRASGTGDLLRTTVTALLEVSDFITLAADAARDGGSIEVNFGTFALGASLVTSDSTAISNSDLNQSGGQSATDTVANDPNASTNQKNLVANLGTSPGSIMFPILYDPMTAVGLLLGKDVDLFIYDTPDIDFSVLYEQSFPIFTGLNAVIKGELQAYSDFYFGFDTTGIRSWFNAFEASDYDFAASVSHLGDIFDGFFIADWSVTETGQLVEGDDVAEVTLKVTFAAGAALGIGGLVEAGVLGGVEAEIGLNLHDLPNFGTGGNTGIEAVYDGKIRFEEVSSILQENPLCLFDMEGTIKAFLEGYLWVGVKVFGSKITLFEASKRFVEVTLARFEWICPDLPDPTVATLENGVLTLAYRDANGSRNPALAEDYTVYLDDIDVTPSDGIDNKVSRIIVTGNGHTQVFDPSLVTSVYAAGTDNNDIYEIDTLINADLLIHGGGGDDLITLTGSSNSDKSRRIYGEAGNDTLIGTAMADLIVGGDDNDNINAMDGADVIFGDNEDGSGTGDDFIWATGTALGTSGLANGFANYIDAGAGSDQILTGAGNDRILAGSGDDVINSGAGIDTIDAGADADQIIAGAGADIVLGGSGDDTLSWEIGDGADNFDGGEGSDEIFMVGYNVNPEEFYKADTSNYIVDDGASDTVAVSASSGDAHISWQHGGAAAITLSGSGIEILSMDTGMGADDILIGSLVTTSVASVKLSTGTQRSLAVESRFVKERNSDGDLVDTAQTLDFKILQIADDNAIDSVRVEGTGGADDYLVSTVESVGVDGSAQSAMRYEHLDGGTDIAGNPTSHVIVDVYDLELNDDTRLNTLGGNDTVDALGVTQALVSQIVIDGGADDDRIIGTNLASVSDVIIGGSGSDRLTGGAGIDRFYEQIDSDSDANIDGDVDVLVESRDADFILSDTRLVIDDSDTPRLSGQFGNETETFTNLFENAELSGFDSANHFELTSWSGGGLLDGGKGGDSYTLELAQLASGRQFLDIADSGGTSGMDSLIYRGSAGQDTIQLDTVYKRDEDVDKRFTDDRWSAYGDYGDGLVIAHFDASDNFSKVDLDDEDALMNVREARLSEGADYQVVNYHSVEQVTVYGGADDDKFISDSTESQIDVYGDAGDDQFYIGSVLKTDTVLVEGQEVTIVLEITDGANVNDSNFFGGEDDDYFEVNHNVADIGLFGDNGDDTFFIKALLTLDDDGELLDLDSGVSSISGVSQDPAADTREVDVDTLVYVENANISINGGAGFDSVALVGTVLSDTFYVFVEQDPVTGENVQRIYGAGVKLQKLLNIERLQLLTGGGDDTVYLYGVDMGLIGDMVIKTGSGSDLVQIGGPEQIINLSYPKNRDQFYAAVEGYEVEQDALGNFLSVDTVSGMPFYQIDETGRIVGFQVENPAVTLQVTLPESTDIDAFLSPVLIDGGEGVNDRVVVNNQGGNNRIRFANTELERKEVVFDYSAFTLASTDTDFVDTVLGDATTGAIAQDLLASAAGDYIRFQDRYYDTGLLNNIASGSQSELLIPGGLSYFNIQNTLNADGSISYARTQLEQFAADFGLVLDTTIVAHPDPTRVGETLYQLNGITKDGVAVAFEAQHKETVVYDLEGTRIVYQDLTALTLKTTAPLRVQFAAGAISSIESIRTDAMDILHGVDADTALHFTGMDEVTLNLTDTTGGEEGSELHIDNSLFTGRLQVQGGIHTDRIFVEQTVAVTTVHGNDGDDEITVGKNGTLDQIGESLYLFGDAGTDTIEVDRADDSSDADVTVDKNLLEHSTGFEQLSRITSAISLQGITDAENALLEAELKTASEAYANDAFAVSEGDIDTALDEMSEETLAQLLDVLNKSKDELETSVEDAADTLRLNDQQLLENQVKLYTRARYYESNAIDDALLDRMSALGLKAQFSVTYSYEILGITFDDIQAYSSVMGLQSGFNTAEDWLRNFGSKVSIEDDDGNAQNITLDASGNRSALQQLLENADGQSDIYDLINGALNQNRQTVFTATEDDGWLDVTFKLELVSTSVHQANDNNVRALAQLYDTLVNDYLGSQDIYAELLKARSYNGVYITNSDLNGFYSDYQNNTDIRGFNIYDPLAGGKTLYDELIASVDAVNLDLSASVLAKQSVSVIAQLQQLDLARSNSFADIYDDKLDALIAQVSTALSSDDYSRTTLASISADLDTLLEEFNPYEDDNGFAADEQMVLAPVYNALAANTSNGLIDVLAGINQLHTDLDGADFAAILNAAAAAAGYDDFETLFKSANYTQARQAYATASELIDSFLIYSAAQPDMVDLPDGVTDVLREIKILDRAAERFSAFVDALESGFDFETFRTDYLANQAAVQQFVANNPQYIAYLQSEARYEAMAASLTRDANDVVTLAALNDQQYQLLVAALETARTQFTSLEKSLSEQYTFDLNYWWFTRTVHLDYTVDYRYVQQKALVENLEAQVALAEAYYDGSESQTGALLALREAYSDQEQSFEALIAELGSTYEAQKAALNAQYLVLKEISGLAVEIIKARGPEQDIEGFADDSSLISEIISFNDTYRIIDENAEQDPLNLTGFVSQSSDGSRTSTSSSVIFQTQQRDYTAVTSVAGMTGDGVLIHVGYDDVERLTLNLGDGADDVQVLDTLGQASAEVFVNTGAGDDEITVSDENDTTEGIVSHLIIDAGTGSNRLYINDINDATADSIIMTNSERSGYTSVTGIAAGSIHYRGAYGQGVFLQAGKDGDDIHVDGVIAEAATLVRGGEGDDDITVTSTTSRADISTTLTIKGELGDDVIDASKAGFQVTIEGNEGDDVIFGSGHDDTLSGNEGNDLILGGLGADTISGDAGNDLVLGDLGSITLQVAGMGSVTVDYATVDAKDVYGKEYQYQYLRDGTISALLSTLTGASSGNGDTLTGGSGNDTLMGGAGVDTITDDDGNSLVVGDHALITYLAGMTLAASSRFAFEGDTDHIILSGTNNTVIGGSGGDDIDTGNGTDFILGDNGEILWSAGVIDSMASTDEAFGGNDDIDLGDGAKTVIAGVGNDTLDAGDGTHRVIGDNGSIDYDATQAGALRSMQSTSDAHGGVDTITLLGASNQIIGGSDGDIITVNTATSTDQVLGDNGSMTFTGAVGAEQLSNMQSDLTQTGGGNDTITLGAGDKVVIAGIGADTVTTPLLSAGTRYVIGDEGEFDFDASNILQTAKSTSTAGDGDTLTLGGASSTDINVVIGGVGGDDIDTGNSTDFILGDNGEILWSAGVIDSMVSTDAAFGGNDDISTQGGNDIVFGGQGADTLTLGTGNDIGIGDNGKYDFRVASISSTDASNADGGNDIMRGNEGDDILLGGVGNDSIDGNSGRDLIFGDQAELTSRTGGESSSPRFRALTGEVLYSEDANSDDAEVQVGSTQFSGPEADSPAWSNWSITVGDGLDDLFGNDYIAGGAGNDTIFGQRGNDTIQGDGSIDGTEVVSASRNPAEDLVVVASSEASTDGDDYIEGGGEDDVIFGNLGQDDIIGGNSSLFGLDLEVQRADGADLIFGGAGTDIGRNDAGDTGDSGHARDADMILGDNGNIYRIVGTNGAPNAGQYLNFNYDNYNAGSGTLNKIVVRAAQLLDYTPGGPDYVPAALTGDHGAGDEIHGESGDDFVYGMTGNDVLFGDGQDDDIIGGWGNDWISGGTGDDGVLGDDGRIYSSRNGFTETLYGLTTAVRQQDIATSGDSQTATINVTDRLKKSVNLTPFNVDPSQVQDPLFAAQYADDIIFGGLGNDALHGGAGDDAISGAEAMAGEAYGQTSNADGNPDGGVVRIDFDRPFNPGNVLHYNPYDVSSLRYDASRPAGEFALYDENDPLRKILLTDAGALSKDGSGKEFFLNFDASEADGDDVIFGDLGNDWLVGGSGNDNLYGGYGDDLLNVDDDLSTNGGLNNTPDADYADLAFGGAGRDIMIGNAEADRLIDWSGEFNTYLVPFNPFGLGTVSRQLQPSLPEFLYALSASDGADPTRAADTNSDPARNGEPDGELGLVTQKDADWGDQTGGPADPQSGVKDKTSGDKVKTNGSNATSNLEASKAAPVTADTNDQAAVTREAAEQIFAEAKHRWALSGLIGSDSLELLDALQVEVVSLDGAVLAQVEGTTIYLDSNAAGWGWFVDPTAGADEEFRAMADGSLQAWAQTDAFAHMDLLTVLSHEIGHVLGYAHTTGGRGASLMDETLAAGVREVPGSGLLHGFNASLDSFVSDDQPAADSAAQPASKRSVKVKDAEAQDADEARADKAAYLLSELNLPDELPSSAALNHGQAEEALNRSQGHQSAVQQGPELPTESDAGIAAAQVHASAGAATLQATESDDTVLAQADEHQSVAELGAGDESNADSALAAATIAGLAGWKLATGERSGTVKLAQRSFDSLRHKQRHVMHWDEAKQCFVGNDDVKTVASTDWEQAARNIRTH